MCSQKQPTGQRGLCTPSVSTLHFYLFYIWFYAYTPKNESYCLLSLPVVSITRPITTRLMLLRSGSFRTFMTCKWFQLGCLSMAKSMYPPTRKVKWHNSIASLFPAADALMLWHPHPHPTSKLVSLDTHPTAICLNFVPRVVDRGQSLACSNENPQGNLCLFTRLIPQCMLSIEQI